MAGHAQRGSRRRDARKRVVLVFGESRRPPYDAQAVTQFVRGLLPDAEVTVEARREFLRLVKGNRAGTRSAASDLAGVLKAAGAIAQVVGVVKHEDTDAVEPSHERIAREIETLGDDVGVEVYAAVAAWELETWLLQWPEPIGDVRPSWRAPTEFQGRDLGQLASTKELLIRAVRPRGLNAAQRARFPDYKESDSVEVARRVRESGTCRTPRAQSRSYARFVERMDALGSVLAQLAD